MFAELQREVFRLHGAGADAAALELIEREFAGHPDQARRLWHWRASFESRLGRLADAVASLESGIAGGGWYTERWLLRDPDLEALHGRADFQALVELCRQRHTAAQAAAAPAMTVLAPEGHAPPHPVLLALHGNPSGAAEDAPHWRPAAERGWLVALPQSSQVGGPGEYMWTSPEQALAELRQHWRDLAAGYRVDPDRLVAGGFSMGAAMALWAALTGALPVRGLLLVAPTLPDLDRIIAMAPEAGARGLRTYVVVGKADPVSMPQAQQLAAALQAAGAACELEVHPELGHEFPDGFGASLDRGLAFVLRG